MISKLAYFFVGLFRFDLDLNYCRADADKCKFVGDSKGFTEAGLVYSESVKMAYFLS